ncbi:MAG: CCA tRNA nucleotidyltransferase, partial [Sphingomonadaceae bacterium]|nr:CCA tRNA nucleotidyltransferase [Sphingomonadaceae bacterium]
MKLPEAEWRARPGLDRLLAALDAEEGATRWVGGAVRDTLLGLPVTDIDCATTIAPDAVIERLRAAGIKVVPTGIAHGTVTAVIEGKPVEVTTLRRDVSTDGRRATVAFTDDWREDAARRDFTINALSADPLSGALHDYFGGLDDLAARRIRFIGDPLRRIAEDHLRILRFFRFHARFGEGALDGAGYAACVARANDLMALSRERIADELLKLLAFPDPRATLRAMLDGAILRPVLPEIGEEGFARLDRLIAREQALAIAPEAIRRLAALLPADAGTVADIAKRLRLSRADENRLRVAAAPESDDI